MDGLTCLHGAWAGGGGIVAAQPLVVLPRSADPIAALGVLPPATAHSDQVVGGGWFGWVGYDGEPQLAFYDHLLRMDASGRWYFEALWSAGREGVLRTRRKEMESLLHGAEVDAPWEVGTFGGASMPAHLGAVERAVDLIRAGEIYQVNVCTRLSASFDGSPAGLFAEATSALQPVFGAYVQGADRTLAALSPELFLRRRGREVTTSPIKGTWPRGDSGGAGALRASVKDSAENVMIVDLMRNDLSRVCRIGSVRATSLLDVEEHPGVWHLVSTVAGELPEGTDDADLLRATFPPGSVTGAPKLRAVSAIGELETGPRGVYTGAVGFVSPCWGAEFAVAIRSFEIASGRIELGVGGGVTADSVPMLEWQECLHKAAPLLGALGARLDPAMSLDGVAPSAAQRDSGLLETLACRDGAPLRMDDHLARLERSSRELYRRGVPPGTAAVVRAAARAAERPRAALRVRLGADGGLQVTTGSAPAPRSASHLRSVTPRPGLWRHKWADRRSFDQLESDGQVPLFVAADGTILETSRGNVFLLTEDGTLITPPLRDDLLPGVTRRALLDRARDEGRPAQVRGFALDELFGNPAFWTSSLSGAVPIASVDGVSLPRNDDHVTAVARGLLEHESD